MKPRRIRAGIGHRDLGPNFLPILSFLSTTTKGVANRRRPGGVSQQSGNRNQPDLAVRSYDDALVIDPTSIEAQVNRGVALREAGDLAAAEFCFDRVLLQSPDFSQAHFNRALVRLQRGDFSNGWLE